VVVRAERERKSMVEYITQSNELDHPGHRRLAALEPRYRRLGDARELRQPRLAQAGTVTTSTKVCTEPAQRRVFMG